MTCTRTMRYHADAPLRTAGHVRVVLDELGETASLERVAGPAGRRAWRWEGGDVGDLVVEEERRDRSFLLTRGDGAPYGRIRRRGRWRPRLEAFDARERRWCLRDGVLYDGHGEPTGRLRSSGADQLHLTAPPVADETGRALLRSLPLCAVLTGTAPLASRHGLAALSAR